MKRAPVVDVRECPRGQRKQKHRETAATERATPSPRGHPGWSSASRQQRYRSRSRCLQPRWQAKATGMSHAGTAPEIFAAGFTVRDGQLRKLSRPSHVAVHEALQEFPGSIVRDRALVVDQSRREMDVRSPAARVWAHRDSPGRFADGPALRRCLPRQAKHRDGGGFAGPTNCCRRGVTPNRERSSAQSEATGCVRGSRTARRLPRPPAP